MKAHQIKITLKEIEEKLPTLSGSEILELDRKIHEYLNTMAYSRAAETAFSEWNDPEEGIYTEKIAVIHQSLSRKKLGDIPFNLMQQVRQTLRKTLGLD